MPTHSIAHRFSATAKEKRCSPRTSAHTATGKHSVFRPVRFPNPAPQFCGDLPFGRTHPLAWPLTVFLSIPHHGVYFFLRTFASEDPLPALHKPPRRPAVERTCFTNFFFIFFELVWAGCLIFFMLRRAICQECAVHVRDSCDACTIRSGFT